MEPIEPPITSAAPLSLAARATTSIVCLALAAAIVGPLLWQRFSGKLGVREPLFWLWVVAPLAGGLVGIAIGAWFNRRFEGAIVGFAIALVADLVAMVIFVFT